MFNIIILLLLFSYIYTHCPPSYTLCSGACIFISTTYLNYCEAWQTCESIHGRLALSYDLNTIQNCESTSFQWIAMTTLLNEVYLNKTGWLWSDGSVTDSTSLWYNGEPDDPTQSCGCTYGNQLGNGPCGYLLPFTCFYQSNIMRHGNLFTKSPAVFHDNTQLGCQSTSTVYNRRACAVKCNTTPYCKSFYYEDCKKQCVITKYVDSSLPNSWINDSYNWEIFN